jgi:hypothetical protein
MEGLGFTKEQIHPIQVILQHPAGQLKRGYHNRRAGLYKETYSSHPGTLSSSLLLVIGTEVTTIEGLGFTKAYSSHPGTLSSSLLLVIETEVTTIEGLGLLGSIFISSRYLILQPPAGH